VRAAIQNFIILPAGGYRSDRSSISKDICKSCLVAKSRGSSGGMRPQNRISPRPRLWAAIVHLDHLLNRAALVGISIATRLAMSAVHIERPLLALLARYLLLSPSRNSKLRARPSMPALGTKKPRGPVAYLAFTRRVPTSGATSERMGLAALINHLPVFDFTSSWTLSISVGPPQLAAI